MKSAKRKCTSSLWIRWKNKRQKIKFWSCCYGSSRTCCGWPLSFFVIDEGKTSLDSSQSITRVNVIIFIVLITAAFTSTVSSHHYRRYHCLAKDSFSASSLSLNLVCWRSVHCLVITLTFLVLFRCLSSSWCLRYLFSSGTRSFFSFVWSSHKSFQA